MRNYDAFSFAGIESVTTEKASPQTPFPPKQRVLSHNYKIVFQILTSFRRLYLPWLVMFSFGFLTIFTGKSKRKESDAHWQAGSGLNGNRYTRGRRGELAGEKSNVIGGGTQGELRTQALQRNCQKGAGNEVMGCLFENSRQFLEILNGFLVLLEVKTSIF